MSVLTKPYPPLRSDLEDFLKLKPDWEARKGKNPMTRYYFRFLDDNLTGGIGHVWTDDYNDMGQNIPVVTEDMTFEDIAEWLYWIIYYDGYSLHIGSDGCAAYGCSRYDKKERIRDFWHDMVTNPPPGIDFNIIGVQHFPMSRISLEDTPSAVTRTLEEYNPETDIGKSRPLRITPERQKRIARRRKRAMDAELERNVIVDNIRDAFIKKQPNSQTEK